MLFQEEPDQPAATRTEMEAYDFKVGISLGTLKEERWLRDRDILRSEINKAGGESIIFNANNDDDDQLQQVQRLLEEDIDVLILVPNDHEKASKAVELARGKDVKVIAYDRLVRKANVDVYISFDNRRVGALMAEYLTSRKPDGRFLIVNGAKSDYNTAMIKNGYDSVFSRVGAEIAAEYWTEDWLTEKAFEQTKAYLRHGMTFDGVIAGNDGLAGAVAEAIAVDGRLEGVPVVGQDADLAACQRIVQGKQAMTVYKPIEKLAEAAASLAKRMALGEGIGIQETLNDGQYDVPYYVLTPIAVDAENMEETVIQDGFHLKSDIYR